MKLFILFIGFISAISLIAADSAIAKQSNTPYTTAIFLKKLKTVKSWDGLFSIAKESTPAYLIQEVRNKVKNEAFPKITTMKDGFIVREEKSGLTAKVLFQKDSSITINGKQWSPRPLANLNEQFLELQDILTVQKNTAYDFLIPSAHAAVPAAILGAVYVGGVIGSVYACVERRKDLTTIPLGMKLGLCALPGLYWPLTEPLRLALGSAHAQDAENFLPTSLKCPKENDGVLEVILKNRAGWVERVRVKYVGDKAVSIQAAVAERGASLNNQVSYDMNGSLNAKDRGQAEHIAMYAGNLKNKVCDASKQEQENYKKALRDNQKELTRYLQKHSPQSEESDRDNSDSQTAE